jgi:hypothetical protein
MDLRTGIAVLLVVGTSCATPPAPTAAALRVEKNPRAIIEGRVLDAHGGPVGGVAVRAMPRSADIPWAEWGQTDAEGRFQLVVYAPGSYWFVLRSGATTVVTPDPRDPGRLIVDVKPGEVRKGVDLLFLEDAWRRVSEESSPAR